MEINIRPEKNEKEIKEINDAKRNGDRVEIAEITRRENEVKTVAENNGIGVVSFEHQRDASMADMANNRKIQALEFNSDGTVKRTPTKYAAVNLESYYINRAKVQKGKIYVVTDYRAIMEQPTGRVYAKLIPAYVIARNKETNALYLEKVVNISDQEFLADFTDSFTTERMAEIKPLLDAGIGVTKLDDFGI